MAMSAALLPLLLPYPRSSRASSIRCGVEPLSISLQCCDGDLALRGAERAITISAEDDATGQRVGSLSLELLPVAIDETQPSSVRPLLSGLIVQPEYRHRGVAKKLVAEAERAARSWDCDDLNLYLYVESSNTAAINLYDRLGYRIACDGSRATAAEAPKGWRAWLPSSGETMCLRKPL